jgi:AcrR family transcriptional regulator
MTSLRRRNTESGYPRGDETKARIIKTAISLFGENGFAGVSAREIASAAGVPAPSLQYYFENKEGLYEACIADIHASAWEAIGPVTCEVEELLTAKADADKVIDGYCRILEALADFLFAMPDAASRALFVAQHRSPSNSPTNKSSGKSATGRRIQECCAAIVARVSRNRLTDEEIGMVCTTINGQLIIVHLAREHVEDMMGWQEITPERIEALKSVVRKHTTVILNSYRS